MTTAIAPTPAPTGLGRVSAFPVAAASSTLPSQSWTLRSPTPSGSSDSTRTYIRTLHGVERLWAYAHTNLGGAFDMVSLFRPASPSPTSATTDLSSWRNAWRHLCAHEPILACRLEKGPEAMLVARDFGKDDEAWGAWLDESVVLVQQRDLGDDDDDDDDAEEEDPAPLLDHCLEHCDFESVKLVLFRSERGEVRRFAITNNHALADAGAVVRLALRLLVLVQQDAATFASVPEGEEFAERLPLALAEACGYDSDASQVPAMLKEATKPSHGLSVVPLDQAIPVSGPWRHYKTFDASTTSSIIARCKAHGLTIASFAQAVVAHASLTARAPAPAPKGVEKTSSHPFAVAAMPFSKLQDVLPQHKRDGAFMAMAMNPISFSVEVGLDGPAPSLVKTSKAVQQAFANARLFPAQAQEGFNQTLVRFYGAMKAGIMPSPTSSFPTLSSLGNLDSTIRSILPPNSPSDKLLTSYHIGSRNPQATMGVHVWTLDGKLTVSLAWNPARFDQAEIQRFWGAICKGLEGLE